MGSPVDDALAVLRHGCYLGGELPTVEEVEAALATVRSALEQLREERDALERDRDSWVDQCEDARRWEAKHVYRAEAAEAEMERLMEGLREQIAKHEIEAGWVCPCDCCTLARALLADSPDGANTEGGEA